MKVAVTKQEFVNIVRRSVKGTTIVSVDLDSPMDAKGKMGKTGNPFFGKGMVKRETLTGMIGYDYGAAVNRLADKEGKEEREAKRHPWGDMDEHRFFRINRKTGKPYLTMKVQSAVVHGFFLPDGEQLNAEDVYAFIPEKNKSSTQADLTAEVIARDYDLSNIKCVRMAGGEYEIVADAVIEQEQEKEKTEADAPVEV